MKDFGILKDNLSLLISNGFIFRVSLDKNKVLWCKIEKKHFDMKKIKEMHWGQALICDKLVTETFGDEVTFSVEFNWNNSKKWYFYLLPSAIVYKYKRWVAQFVHLSIAPWIICEIFNHLLLSKSFSMQFTYGILWWQ